MNHHNLMKLAIGGLLAGGIALTGCKKSPTSGNPSETDAVAVAKAALKAKCEANGKVYKENDSCADYNECAGIQISGNTVVEHECKEHNDCAGAYCADPAA